MIEGDEYFETCFGQCSIMLRRCKNARFQHMFVSKCGHFVINEQKPNVTDIIRPNDNQSYLNCYDWRVHQLVGSAWVHNPCPTYFTVLDHINNCKQDNRAENLRWVSPHLNSLNRTRVKWVTYRSRFGKYEGRVELEGKTERVWDKCPMTAKRKTQDLLTSKFNDVYNRTIKLDERNEPSRDDRDLYWRDPVEITPGRHTPNDFGISWDDQYRCAKLSV